MKDRTNHVLASIDGALASHDMPDGMRWTPRPESVHSPDPFDGDLVPQPPQAYEPDSRPVRTFQQMLPRTITIEFEWVPVRAAIEAAGEWLRAHMDAARQAAPNPIPDEAYPADKAAPLRTQDPRAWALQQRRTRSTGPAIRGPEQSHRPRRAP